MTKSSARGIAAEIGISHPTLLDFIAEGSTRTPHGPGRAKIVAWAELRGAEDPTRESVAFYRGKQEALLGMMSYVMEQQAEIGQFLATLRTGSDRRPSPSLEQAADEAEVLRQLPALPPLAKKKGKRPA